mgnify:CR=1 FL=1
MASKLRCEFVRLDKKDSNGLQAMSDRSDVAPLTKAVNGTAWTGSGRWDMPARVNGYGRYHIRLIADVETLVTFSTSSGTTEDAAVGVAGGIAIPANTPTLIPIDGAVGWKLSAATGLTYA